VSSGRWPADIEILADALGANAILLVGDGDGAELALRCARALPGQIAKVALLDPDSAAAPGDQEFATRTWFGPLSDNTFAEVFAWLSGRPHDEAPSINDDNDTERRNR